MVANPAQCQLNITWKRNVFFSLGSPFTPENLVSRDTGSAVPSLVSLLILHTQAESGVFQHESCTVGEV